MFGIIVRFSPGLIRYALKLSNGDNEIRTRDPLLARQVLSQLSYTPVKAFLKQAFFLF